ncbi:glycoside hydrolase family 13 protein [Parafrigoribacterium mesophilum]|uniref:glycoside hydrolase family 13 protein n=1 Tax=Parafrigoribacterium mesophilum TaxID=433646 RepID=UPI0031FDBE1B
MSAISTSKSTTAPGEEWWRSAVIYQVYPRSFADASGDGMGDLPGITSRLPALAELGVDAVWLSPFFPSPQKDAGYDVSEYCDVDPRFGTLDDFQTLEATAHGLGLRLIVDLVPNHTSDQHRWFQEALASEEGSEQRARYLFRDGKGPNGELPPNNWGSVFGGGAWTRVTRPDGSGGQWYLHLFDTSQPDLNWDNPWVREQFRGILRFWLDRGVDGFRVDVAHGLIKKAGLPDYTKPESGGSMGSTGLNPAAADRPAAPDPPYWGQDGVHEIYRDWRRIIDEYGRNAVFVAEAWVEPLAKLARWVRPGEMHQAFNFEYLEADWDARRLRRVITDSLKSFGSVGAPSTWVLSNHDVIRHATRLALTAPVPQGQGLGPGSTSRPIPALGLKRARAATCLMLALPGSAYLYQGEELGLPEVVDLPDSARRDPTWFRSGGTRYGRDGCRVPIPWEQARPAYGFNATGHSWLPQPDGWAQFARDAQDDVPQSTLQLYRSALALRSELALGTGSLRWSPGYGRDIVTFRNGSVTVILNAGTDAVNLPPDATVLLASEQLSAAVLPPDTAVWLRM